MGPFDYQSTLLILHGLSQVSACLVVRFITYLHDLKFCFSSANPTFYVLVLAPEEHCGDGMYRQKDTH